MGPNAKLALVGMGVVALGLAGWLAWDLSSDGPAPTTQDEDLPPLPEPGEPRTRAMVSSGGGFGWTWVNPRPQALPTLYGVDTIDAGERALFVGVGGAAIEYREQGLRAVRTGTDANLRAVAWVGSDGAVVVGDEGLVLQVDGAEATAVESGVEVDLRDVVATDEGSALAVGDAGTALRIGADGVELVATDTDEDLLAVFARGPDRFAAGTAGTVLRFGPEGVQREVTPVRTTLRGIGGCPSGSIYAVGDRATLIRRHLDGAWRSVSVSGDEGFTSVSCDHGRVAVVTAAGRVMLVSGNTTLELPSSFERVWHDVDGASEGRSWVVGLGGRLATIERDHVRTRTAGPTHPIRAMGAMGGALVAVGEWGKILQQREQGFAERESPTEAGLAALVQLGEGRLLAVGDFGAIVDIRHDRAELLESPTESSLRAVVAEDDELLMVGAQGVVLRGALGALRLTAMSDVGDLHGLAGTPSNAIAVGDGGVVLRLNQRGFQRVPCDAGETLRAVARIGDGAWAVGDDGVIVRVHDASCVVEQRGGPTLHAVGRGPEGRPLAVGDGGTTLSRGEDGSWEPAGLAVGRASLRVIYRSQRDVFVAGTGGVIARHVRIDGE